MDCNEWAVFVVDSGIATKQIVQIGQNNGLQAQIVSGLNGGDSIVLYPGTNLVDGASVQKRILELAWHFIAQWLLMPDDTNLC